MDSINIFDLSPVAALGKLELQAQTNFGFNGFLPDREDLSPQKKHSGENTIL
jgi:hypothetical protein